MEEQKLSPYTLSDFESYGRRLEWQRLLEEEDNMIVKWEQEDVETLYSLLNNNNNNNVYN